MNETNEVKETRRSRKKKPVSLLTMALLILAVLCTAGVTAACLKQETDPVVNTFTPGSVTPSIVEKCSASEKSSVKIQNTGNSDAYIRVAVVGNKLATGSVASWSDYKDKIVGPLDVDGNIDYKNGEGEEEPRWFSYGGYYYWTGIVPAGKFTEELLNSPIVLYADENEMVTINNQVTILTEAIQAKGEDKDGNRPVTKAWGIKVDKNTGNLKYPESDD